MAGMTLSERDVRQLAAVVERCEAGPDASGMPLSADVVDAVVDLFRLDVFFLQVESLRSGQRWFGQSWEADDEAPHLLEYPAGRGLAEDPRYLALPCSLPERRGDFDTVYRGTEMTGVGPDAGWLLEEDPVLAELPYEVMACAILPGAYQARLLCWRGRDGSDFTDRDLFLVRLLRPHLVQATASWRRDHPAAVGLTPRQRELMLRVRDGDTNRQIARRTGLSEATVRTHLNQIYRRLGVRSRTEAVTRVFDAS